ncbi:MAG: hypothetical protein GWN01_13535 [Nitrosopumilaceae archaeon]|nr:hypothetical protein [Nitrosopumilaceae archaeon]NIU01886.1 hypothetical protein [Nitrosopumilaceae archaeon]NIU88290.1 hypothetical protein [Nitrosopumilaceae archaeon]NIV66582.1 hypothetical protein [Nitrosopumilaceae archaeon]NIX62487.1 hypothetical protein [Nitrosopumilaceae archaeon]
MPENKVKIEISQETENRLRKFGIMGSTHDSILNDLMDHNDVCDGWWNRK